MKNQSINGFYNKINEVVDLIEEKQQKGFKDPKEEYVFRDNIKETLYKIHHEYLFEYIDNKSVTSREDFEKQFINAIKDVKYEIENYSNIQEYLENIQEILEKENNYFQQLIEMYRKSSNRFQDKKSGNDKFVIKEIFNSSNTIDLESIKGIPVEIDSTNNMITIKKKNSFKETIDQVEISNNSIGFPGNTHEATLKNNELVFLGEENLNIRIENVLNEEDIFSFENIIINNNDLDNIQSKSYYYKENISWNSEEQQTYLELKVSFDELKKINEFKIVPDISTDKDFLELIVESIFVDDKQGEYQELINEPLNIYDINSFIFKEQNVKEVVIKLRQLKGYTTKIGYLNYYLNSFESGINYNLPQNKKTHSIDYLGMRYNKLSKELSYPSTTKSNKYSDEEIIEHLFSKPLDKEFEKCDLEIINAQKFNINIKSIDLINNEFEDQSTFISKNVYIEDEIKNVYLITDENISTNDIETINEAYEYYISHDNGKNWYKINPINRFSKEDKIKILYNQNVSNSLAINIPTENPVHNLKLKIVLNKVSDNLLIPVLREYQMVINE